ncbi:hypothetical protein RIF29_15248 [Crotalaria pallida]|uniref:THIF-type NAD/FAD binding fold domain-containing protein n=1 Tax=Crotalaria pallida TaxID=3830 RepID=A0AAN9FIM8_CROPI
MEETPEEATTVVASAVTKCLIIIQLKSFFFKSSSSASSDLCVPFFSSSSSPTKSFSILEFFFSTAPTAIASSSSPVPHPPLVLFSSRFSQYRIVFLHSPVGAEREPSPVAHSTPQHSTSPPLQAATAFVDPTGKGLLIAAILGARGLGKTMAVVGGEQSLFSFGKPLSISQSRRLLNLSRSCSSLSHGVFGGGGGGGGLVMVIEQDIKSCGSRALHRGVVRHHSKNLILAGVKSVTLHDEGTVELWDLSSNFVFSENDIGKNRAMTSVSKLQELNNAVLVQSLTTKLTKEQLSNFQVLSILLSTLFSS